MHFNAMSMLVRHFVAYENAQLTIYDLILGQMRMRKRWVDQSNGCDKHFRFFEDGGEKERERERIFCSIETAELHQLERKKHRKYITVPRFFALIPEENDEV